jgi:hypothetical protein
MDLLEDAYLDLVHEVYLLEWFDLKGQVFLVTVPG